MKPTNTIYGGVLVNIVMLEESSETTIHKIIKENELLKDKMSSLRKTFASLIMGMIAEEDEAVQEDLTIIEEILTTD